MFKFAALRQYNALHTRRQRDGASHSMYELVY